MKQYTAVILFSGCSRECSLPITGYNMVSAKMNAMRRYGVDHTQVLRIL